MDQDEWEESAIFIELADWKRLQAAEGYIELGMYAEAEAELEEIDSLCWAFSPGLVLKLCAYAGQQKWAEVQTVAQKMAQHEPGNAQWAICWASATRRAQSIDAAKAILLKALQDHPNDPNIHYNLSCYESRLHHFRQAHRHLARAIQLDPRFKMIALHDNDLQPLWLNLTSA